MLASELTVVSKSMGFEWWQVTGRNTAKCDWCDQELERYTDSPHTYIVESQTSISVSGELMDKGPDLICRDCYMKTDAKPYPESEWTKWKKDYKKMIRDLGRNLYK